MITLKTVYDLLKTKNWDITNNNHLTCKINGDIYIISKYVDDFLVCIIKYDNKQFDMTIYTDDVNYYDINFLYNIKMYNYKISSIENDIIELEKLKKRYEEKLQLLIIEEAAKPKVIYSNGAIKY